MIGHPAHSVVFVVPDAIDDAERVSGGNVYDRRLRDGLRAAGCEVRMLPVADAAGAVAEALAPLPDDAVTLIDGLLVAREPDAVAAAGARLRVVVLAHMVAADLADRERDALRAARLIVTTSGWTRSELIAQDGAEPHRIVVARPGTDPARATAVSEQGGRLLCVATVAPHKGQDLLVRALAEFADRTGWSCTLAGSLLVAPDYVDGLTRDIAAAGLSDRIRFAGILTGDALEAAYGAADLVILPSRSESYGMAAAEALAHGLPVLATGVGGIPEAIDGSEAGMIVSPDDPWALAVVLRQWWASGELRRRRTAAARAAREAARSWGDATGIVASALAAVAGAADEPPAALAGLAGLSGLPGHAGRAAARGEQRS